MAEEIPTEDDYPTYEISVGVNTSLEDGAEWHEQYITELRIYISQDWWSDELQDSKSRDVGTGEGFILHVGHAMNNGESIAEICDYHSAEAHEYRSAVITTKNEWRSQVQKRFDDELFDRDLLAFTKMEIKPEHRAKRVGQRAMIRTMQMFSGGCGLILIKPWPLQYTSKEFSEIAKEGKTAQGWTDQQRKQDFAKLRRYWSELGFQKIGKSDFYGFPTYKPLPTIESVLGKSNDVPSLR